MPPLRRLDPFEQRVIGCLVEKELSTPDAYPLTLNALVAACNQTSNREPVSRLAPADVDAALHRLMGDLLVWRDRGSRALRWKHSLDTKLGVRDPAAKALLAELLLRGEQTPGELRSRSPRMHEFASLGEVEAALGALAARGMVEELARQPGQKERRWRHLLGSGAVPAVPSRELETIGGAADEDGHEQAVPPVKPAAPLPAARPTWPAAAPAPAVSRLPAVSSPHEPDLRSRVAALEQRVEELAALVARLSGSHDAP